MHKTKELHLNTHLKNAPLFSSLNNEQLNILYDAGHIKGFAKDCIIFFQRDPGDTFYIVVSGRVKITLLNEDGKEIILSILLLH